MPRYYFHVLDDLDAGDDEGVELRDLNEARAYATHSARHLMSEWLNEGGAISLDHRIVGADAQCHIAATVRFRDAVKIEG